MFARASPNPDLVNVYHYHNSKNNDNYTASLEKPGFCLSQLIPYKRKPRFLTYIETNNGSFGIRRVWLYGRAGLVPALGNSQFNQRLKLLDAKSTLEK